MSIQTAPAVAPKGKAAAAKTAAADQLETAAQTERNARELLRDILHGDATVSRSTEDGEDTSNPLADIYAARGEKAEKNPHATTANAIGRALLSWDKRSAKLALRVEKVRAAADAATAKEDDAKAPGFARLDDDTDRVALTAAAVKALVEAWKGHRGGVLVIEGDDALALISALADAVEAFATPDTAVTYTVSGKPARIRARHVETEGVTELHLSVVV